MKINFSVSLFDFEGKEIPDTADDQNTLIESAKIATAAGQAPLAEAILGLARNGSVKAGGKSLSLKDVCIRALGAGVQQKSDPKSVMEYFDLGMALRPGGEMEISTEQATMLKELVPLVFKSVIISGQACKLLNG